MSAAPPAKTAAPNTAETYWKALRQSQLLTEEVISEWQQMPGLPDDPARLAQMMVKANVITNFQAKQLLLGRYRGFFLGSYKILDQLGAGGMGTVFVAEHTTLVRKVALKVLPADKARDKVALERFYREARSAAALNHEHIVKLHDISQGAGVHFLVMEFVDGITLQELIDKTGPMHYTQAVQIVTQIAQGLQHAHAKGFVHRDIKPANIIQDKNGVVKILDMGLARSFDKPEDNLTGQIDADCVMGTVDYIAPEQALRKPADHRSDIYSLGATFFNLITGTTPFQGTTAQKLMGHQLSEVPKLHKLRGSVPPELNSIVARMMAKSPKERYQSCGELIDALARWVPSENQNSVVESGRILENDTRRSDRQAKMATKKTLQKKKKKAAKEKRRKLILAGIGSGIAAMVVMLVWMLWPSNKPELGYSARVRESNKANISNSDAVLNVNTEAMKPILTADFGDNPQPRCQLSSNLVSFQNNGVNWYMNSWNSGDEALADWVDRQGRRGMYLANVKGNSCQIFSDQLPGRASRGQKYLVNIEYMTGNTASAFIILRRDNDIAKEEKILLPVTSSWNTLAQTITVKDDCNLFIYIQNSSATPGNEIIIKKLIVSTSSNDPSAFQPSSPTGNGQTVFTSDFGASMPFSVTKMGQTVLTGAGELQPYWFHCYRNESTGEFSLKKINGVSVFGLRTISGEPSSQIGTFFNNALRTLPTGTKLCLTIEYMTDDDGEAAAIFQQDGKSYAPLSVLPLTPTNTWRTVELNHQLDDKEPTTFVINSSKVNGWVYIKSLTLRTIP